MTIRFRRARTALNNATCAALVGMAIFSSCRKGGESADYRQTSGEVWHTFYSITYRSPKALDDSITAVLEQVGRSVSVFDPESLVSDVNSRDSVTVDEDFRRVYEMSRRINTVSGGSFDPTLSPLITAWGFGKGHQATADTLRIDSLLAITGITRTRLDGDRLMKENPAIEFNFSAVAKGYGCDRVGEMLRRNGVTDYLIEIGGEIVASGERPGGGGWRVAIEKPDSEPHNSAEAVVVLKDMSMATSGNYRNFHESGGERYGHTLSPVTGRPARTDVLSATVIAPQCMEADALATACMAMGSGRAMTMLDSLRLPAMLILANDSLLTTAPMQELLRQTAAAQKGK